MMWRAARLDLNNLKENEKKVFQRRYRDPTLMRVCFETHISRTFQKKFHFQYLKIVNLKKKRFFFTIRSHILIFNFFKHDNIKRLLINEIFNFFK